MTLFPTPPNNHRVGIHYFPDFFHFKQSDLQTWLPMILSMNASWMTLHAPASYAIPEFFINALKSNHIEPILQIQGMTNHLSCIEDLKLLLNSYSKWGIHYISFFDKPNQRTSWTPTEWAQDNLVDRFLDRFIPLAKATVDAGLFPIFPPFQPGGDYWDLVFLQSAIRGLIKRNQSELVNNFILGAYACSSGHPLDWGRGGPTRWPGAKPYFTPTDQQDHRGVYIFDWYSAITKTELGVSQPILLLKTGSFTDRLILSSEDKSSTVKHTDENLEIFSKFYLPTNLIKEEFAPDVLAACFWLLSTTSGDPVEAQAWFKSSRNYLPVVDAIRGWISINKVKNNQPELDTSEDSLTQATFNENPLTNGQKIIQHYLLLPVYKWGVADWDLDTVRPYILQEKPTIGFSVDEASKAMKVTVFEPKSGYCEKMVNDLCLAGCHVERLNADGIIIAQ